LAARNNDIALGFADEVWWSRFTQPAVHSWCEGQPLHLLEQVALKSDPDRKALACYGLYLPQTNEMALRFVAGRPISRVTCEYLAWLTTRLADQGKRALILIWDNASWHTSQLVRSWIKAHNRRVKHTEGCRLIVFRLPTKSPWLNAIEPKWVHGKRAIAEPARVLSTAEVMQRVCTYYHCAQLEPLTQSLC
jgi:DDE superfamily endonuclease